MDSGTALLDESAEVAVIAAGVHPDRPNSEIRSLFREQGFVRLDECWTPALSEALAEEARRLYEDAAVPTNGPRTPVAEHRLTGRATPIASGPVLAELHHYLASHVRALSGRMLVPSFANYGYFPEEDGTILHVDTDATEIVVLTNALGVVGPLHVHNELRGFTASQLGTLESDPQWDGAAGVRLGYPTHGAVALRGALIPHRRPSHPVASLSAVAAMHYCSPY